MVYLLVPRAARLEIAARTAAGDEASAAGWRKGAKPLDLLAVVDHLDVACLVLRATHGDSGVRRKQETVFGKHERKLFK